MNFTPTPMQGEYLQGPGKQGPFLQGPVQQGPFLQGPVQQGPFLQGPGQQGAILQGPVQPSTVIINQQSAPAPVIVAQPTLPICVGPCLTDRSGHTVCPNPICQREIMTQVTYKVGLLGWIIFLTMIFLGCWLGCCLIPFFVDDLKDVEHTCPQCHYNVYTYKRM